MTYSVNETLQLLSIGRTTFYQLVERGDFTLGKIGKKSLVYAVDIAAFLSKMKTLD
jgi:excisionase family DNA binding protein